MENKISQTTLIISAFEAIVQPLVLFITLFPIFSIMCTAFQTPVDWHFWLVAGNSFWRYLSHQGPPQKQKLAKTNKIQIK